MPRLKTAFILAAAIVAMAAWAAWAQDDVMVMDSKELGTHERALVKFGHEKHAENIECNTCHHEYDKYFNNTSEDGKKCSECHKASANAKNKIPLVIAFHKGCKKCHNGRLANKQTSGPTMCGQCHVRPPQGGKAK